MLIQDVRFALRLMRKNAVFSLTAAGSLALSIGALTIAFSAVNAIVFKPLPIADPERVVYLQNSTIAWSYPDYRDLQERLDVDALAGYRIAMMNVGLEPEPSILWGYLVTGNYFEALGVTPAAGRFFTPQEDAGEAPGCGAGLRHLAGALRRTRRRRRQHDPDQRAAVHHHRRRAARISRHREDLPS